MPAAAPALTVVLRFPETEAYPAYRLVVMREGEAKPVWRTDGLERSPEGVQLALPQRYIPPGRYRLSLAGLVTHTITPEQLGTAYEGLLNDKDHYLGVLMKWV